MARNVTLQEILKNLRLETGKSDSEAFGKGTDRAKLVNQINTTQEWLYDNWDWGFLDTHADKQVQAGQRFYDVPTEFNLDSFDAVYLKRNGLWIELYEGIGIEHYNTVDSELDTPERRDPVERWDVRDVSGNTQIEVWPIAASNTDTLRFFGTRSLPKLVSDSDKALLDDLAIVFFSAAELLAGKDDAQSQLKLQKGNDRLKRIRANLDKRSPRSFGMSRHNPKPNHLSLSQKIRFVR